MCAESSPVSYVTMPGLQRWKWGRFPARVPGDGNEAAGIKSVQNTAIPMDSLWTPYGLPMDSLWTTYGLPMDYLWTAYGLPMDCLWTTYGLPMDYLWTTYGLPMEQHRANTHASS